MRALRPSLSRNLFRISEEGGRTPYLNRTGKKQPLRASRLGSLTSQLKRVVRVSPIQLPIPFWKLRFSGPPRNNARRDKAHFAVAATTDDGDTVFLASDLTRAITTLLEITNSLCVCWLNGPVLTSRKDFVWIASKLLRVGQPPFLLWVGVNWRPDGCLVHTKGMAQFGAPDIFLGQQSKLSEEAVSYLHQLVRHVLTPGNTLIEGQTIDGPNCIFRVKSLEGRANNKTGLLLWPVQPNSHVAG